MRRISEGEIDMQGPRWLGAGACLEDAVGIMKDLGPNYPIALIFNLV